MSSPESEQIRVLLKSQVAPAFQGQPSLEQLRALMLAIGEQTLPENGTVVEKVTAGAVPGEWITTPGADAERVILFLHGGGYCLGSCSSHRGLASLLSRAAGVRALIIDYRLAPEHPFPAGLEDAVAAYRWLLGRGVDPKHIAVAGDSAGGGLTLATLLSLRDAGDPLPAGAVLLSPWTDLALTGESLVTRAELDPVLGKASMLGMTRWYIGDMDPRTPLASPLYAEMRGLPPLLVHVGDHEVLLDDAVRVATRARAAGVDVTLEVWDEMWHVFHATAPRVPEARQAVEKVGEFLRARLR